MDRFELETAITDCLRVSDDLDLMLEDIADYSSDVQFNCDTVYNALLGIQELHRRRCQRLMSVFEAMLRAGKIANT